MSAATANRRPRKRSPLPLLAAVALIALVAFTAFSLMGRDGAANETDARAKDAVRAALFAGHEMWGRFDAADPAELSAALSLVLTDGPASTVSSGPSSQPSEISLAPTTGGFTVAVRGGGDRCWYGRFAAGEPSRYGAGRGDCEARLRTPDSIDEPLRFPVGS